LGALREERAFFIGVWRPAFHRRAMAATERWHERTLQDGEWLCASFGYLTLVVMSILEEWRVAPLYGAQCACLDDAKMPPDDLPWQRWDRGEKAALPPGFSGSPGDHPPAFRAEPLAAGESDVLRRHPCLHRTDRA
jgi:hypothetical protein